MKNGLFGYIIDSDCRFRVNAAHGFYKSIPDDVYLTRYYKARTGRELDLNNPKTFNEKLSKLKAMAIMINVCTWNNLKINNCPNEELLKFNNELYGEDGWIQNTKDDTFEELAEHLANAIKSKYRKLKRR